MNGKCLSKCIVYKAEIEANNNKLTYYGASESEFKSRHNNNSKSFRSRRYGNDSELSKYIWKPKDSNTNYALKWSIASYASESEFVTRSEPKVLLIKRTELISKCRHRNKFLISNVKYTIKL